MRWVPQTEVRGCRFDSRSPAIASRRATRCGVEKPRPSKSFDFEAFTKSDYDRAVEDKVASETISKVLYPNDSAHRGKELRSSSSVFLGCSLQDMLRIIRGSAARRDFHEKWRCNCNDTHPAVAVAN